MDIMFWQFHATTIKFEAYDRIDYIDIVQILWKYLGMIKYSIVTQRVLAWTEIHP